MPRTPPAHPIDWRTKLRDLTRPTDAGCSVFTGMVRPDGTGELGRMSAHRLAWSLTNGHLPRGLIVRQTCGNLLCVAGPHLLTEAHSPVPKVFQEDPVPRKKPKLPALRTTDADLVHRAQMGLGATQLLAGNSLACVDAKGVRWMARPMKTAPNRVIVYRDNRAVKELLPFNAVQFLLDRGAIVRADP